MVDEEEHAVATSRPLIQARGPLDDLPAQTLLTEADATVFGLEIEVGDFYLQATGSSKRKGTDPPDRQLGIILAQARAYASASEALLKEAIARVERNDEHRKNLEQLRQHVRRVNRERREQARRDLTDWVANLPDADDETPEAPRFGSKVSEKVRALIEAHRE